MRAQKSGHIIQISSVGGRLGMPGNAAYFASKWAVGGFTESVVQELAHLGVRITALEPGGMRTGWGKSAFQDSRPRIADYEPAVGKLFDQLAGYWGNEAGDPVKVAKLVVKIADVHNLPPHILVGSDALEFARQADKSRAEQADQWAPISVSTNLAYRGLPPAFP